MSQKTEIEWFGVDECLPVIPQHHYAVGVLVLTFDSSLEQAFPGSGHRVIDAHYGCTTDRHGKKCQAYAHSELEFDFQEMCPGLYPDSDWVPVFDKVVAWAYWPSGPRNYYVKQENTREHTLYKTGDTDAPDVILDRNGEVVLSLCRVCGGAESCLPTHCPNRELSCEEMEMIAKGVLDF